MKNYRRSKKLQKKTEITEEKGGKGNEMWEDTRK
jgi:hypothetical protein